MKQDCLILGLNASWQKVLEFEDLRLNGVNRAQRVTSFAAGKGINVAKAYQKVSGRSPTLLQFIGGHNGELIKDDLNNLAITHHSIETQHNTRVCTTLCAENTYSEIIEPSYAANPEQWQKLSKTLLELCAGQILVISGTFLKGATASFFEAAQKCAQKSPIYLDSVHHPDKFSEIPLECLKINFEELQQLSGEEDLEKACEKMNQNWKFKHLIITNESKAVYHYSHGDMDKYQPPTIDKLINPIGAGDTFMAALVKARQEEESYAKAIEYAMTIASKKCLVDRIEDLVL
ncbi:MAG: hypothetical protein HQL32_10115 [Planctomycetes bacterium]|nr:hypothetical protein [Planctomycetota bacterium]